MTGLALKHSFAISLLVIAGCTSEIPTADHTGRANSGPPPIMEPEPNTTGDPEAIRPFEIAVPDAVLEDLRVRLERTRLPDQLDRAIS